MGTIMIVEAVAFISAKVARASEASRSLMEGDYSETVRIARRKNRNACVTAALAKLWVLGL
jgi:hypothetical protein